MRAGKLSHICPHRMRGGMRRWFVRANMGHPQKIQRSLDSGYRAGAWSPSLGMTAEKVMFGDTGRETSPHLPAPHAGWYPALVCAGKYGAPTKNIGVPRLGLPRWRLVALARDDSPESNARGCVVPGAAR